jgi:ornithine cyclodeaminase
MTTKVVAISDIKKIIQKVGYVKFNHQLIKYMQEDFKNWQTFDKKARIASFKNQGVMELMPVCGDDLFSFKYVNGHPNNPKINKLTVSAIGMLADTKTGEPVLVSEMTLLTAIRTGATTALASKYLANRNAHKIGIIGCGSQSEFQILAHLQLFDLTEVYYHDEDILAMQKFAKNLEKYNLNLIPTESGKEVVINSQILITCTAKPEEQIVIDKNWLQKGTHLNAIGGDSHGKTELNPAVLDEADKVVIEYFEQTAIEGEIQNWFDAKDKVYAELWEIIAGQKTGREFVDEITIFDGVGFALEDYSILRLVNDLSNELEIYQKLDLIPDLVNCKDLYSLL